MGKNKKEKAQISADELLSKLKENLGDDMPIENEIKSFELDIQPEEEIPEVIGNGLSFESPVPKSEIADLDVDSLMKMFLSEEDYNTATKKDTDPVNEKIDSSEFDGKESDKSELAGYQVPDVSMYEELNKNGKVCDIPGIDEDTAPVEGKNEDGSEKEVRTAQSDDETILASDLHKYFADNPGSTNDDFGDIFDDIPIADLGFSIDSKEDKKDDEDSSKTIVVKGGTEKKISEPEPETRFFTASDSESTAGEASEAEDDATRIHESLDDLFGDDNSSSETVPTDTDTNIIVGLGMDEELDEADESDNIKKLREENEIASVKVEESKEQTNESPRQTEYTELGDRKGILASYSKKILLNFIALLGTAVVSVVLFFYENVTTFGLEYSPALDPHYYPTVNIMVGLQILFISFVFALPYLIRGTKAIIEKKPTTESFVPFILFINVIFSFVSTGFVSGTYFRSYFLPSSIAVFAVVLSRRFDLRREMMSFKVVSAKGTKYAIESISVGSEDIDAKSFDDFADSSDIFRIKKSNFVDGFFKRTQTYSTRKLTYALYMIFIVILGCIAGLVGGIKETSVTSGIISAYTAMVFSVPASLIILFSYPVFRCTKGLYAMGSTYVGDAFIDQYTSAGAISFDDGEAFSKKDVKINGIHMVDNDYGKMYDAIYFASSVFGRIGGYVYDALLAMSDEMTVSQNVEIITLEKNGIDANVDGRRIRIGTINYMRECGFSPVVSDNDEKYSSVMYLVVDDEQFAKFFITYKIDEDFAKLVHSLNKTGVCVGIKSCDPNVDDSMVSKLMGSGESTVIKVIKYNSLNERDGESERIDSGIVSRKSQKSLLHAFAACDKVKSAMNPGQIISVAAMLIGLIVTILFVIFGKTTDINSLWPSLLCIVSAVISIIWVNFSTVDI